MRLKPWVALVTFLGLTVPGLPAATAAPEVVECQGKASFQRKGWKGWSPLRFGTELAQGDLIKVEVGGSVKIRCPDDSVKSLPAGQIRGVPCSEAGKTLASGPRLLSRVRGDADEGGGLTLLSPRWTWLTDGSPTLRWSAPPEVKRFTVTVRGGGSEWTATVESATSLPYPKDAPPLIPGKQYAVVVKAEGLSSTRADAALPLFEVLPPARAAEAKRGIEKIRSLGLAPGPTAWLETEWLAGQGLLAEAIETGEAAARSFPEAALHRALGSAYKGVGLAGRAVDSYRKALELDEGSADSADRARVAEDLADLCLASGPCKSGEARRQLEAARGIYQKLGAAADVRRVEEQLALFE